MQNEPTDPENTFQQRLGRRIRQAREGAGEELPIASDHLGDADVLLRSRECARQPDVVDAEQDHHVVDAGLGEDVPVEPGQGARSEERADSLQRRSSAASPSRSSRFPTMPSLSTPSCLSSGRACSRRARKSGQRWFASTVVSTPSVIESPRATIEAPRAEQATLTPVRKYHQEIP